MTTVTNIATQVLNENNYSTSDISATNLEYLIDNAIQYVNLRVGAGIAALSGVAGSKSITGTDTQILTVKTVTILMLRAYKDRGPNSSLGPMAVSAVIADPQYSFYRDMIEQCFNGLRGRSFART